MNFLFRRQFWGFALLVFGGLLLLNMYFDLNIPIFGTLVALILIAIGLSMLYGWSTRGWSSDHEVVFGEAELTGSADRKEYNVVFGRGLVDWRKMMPKGKGDYLEANAVFAEEIVRISPNVPMRIKASAVFGETRLPNGQTISFGDREYTTKSYKAGSAHFVVRANAVFGSLKIVED